MNDERDPSVDEVEDAELPPRAWLEEWTVPEVPHDLSQRVMQRMHDSPTLSPPLALAQRRASNVVATTTAVLAAAAAAAALVISLTRPSEVPAAAPAPAPETVVVGGAQAPAFGNLVLDVAPGDAGVEIDGVPLAGPSPFVATNLPAGRHEIRVHREDYQPWVKTIDVPAAELQLPITLVTEKPDAAAHDDDAARPGPPAPANAATEISVSGSLDRELIRRVVRAHIDEVRECYNQGLVRDPRLQGRVAVQFRVGLDGAVESAIIEGSTLGDPKVETCIVNAVGRWKFPKPEGGTVLITYPFVLTTE